MKPVRIILVALATVCAFFALSQSAFAAASCTNGTTFQPGQTIVVTGSSAGTSGDTAQLLFNGSAVGSPVSVVNDTFTVSGSVPTGTPPGGPYSVSVLLTASDGASGVIPACAVTVVAAPTPAPTPVPTPVPTAAPVATPGPVATFPVFIPISVSQQQQQQQQGGGGGGGGGSAGRGGQQQQGHSQSGGGQQQQQQQQQFGGDGILPRTGADTGRMAAWGAGLLGLGLLLVVVARRRRRRARNRALAELPPIDAVVVESDGPWLPGTAHPSEFLTEADGVPPVYLPVTPRLALPPAEDAGEDILTPSF